LTRVFGLPKDRLYVTYFEGDEKLGLKADLEAKWVIEMSYATLAMAFAKGRHIRLIGNSGWMSGLLKTTSFPEMPRTISGRWELSDHADRAVKSTSTELEAETLLTSW
jgi:hypothetical protein